MKMKSHKGKGKAKVTHCWILNLLRINWGQIHLGAFTFFNDVICF